MIWHELTKDTFPQVNMSIAVKDDTGKWEKYADDEFGNPYDVQITTYTDPTPLLIAVPFEHADFLRVKGLQKIYGNAPVYYVTGVAVRKVIHNLSDNSIKEYDLINLYEEVISTEYDIPNLKYCKWAVIEPLADE